MGRKARPPRLYLRTRDGRQSVWCIRDGQTEISTGLPETARPLANDHLAAYLAQPPRFRRRRRGIGKKPEQATGFIYFIRMMSTDAPIKIGFSTNPSIRLSNIAVSSPFDLEMLATFPAHHAVEAMLHSTLLGDRLRGEWFRSSDDVWAAVAAAREERLLEYLAQRPIIAAGPQ